MTNAFAWGFTRKLIAIWPLFALGSTSALLSISGGPASPGLRYERVFLLEQPWRLLTGHLVHLGSSHLLLNLAGLALIAWVFAPGLAALQWLWLLFVSVFAIDLGFWLLEPQLEWYVGLSGVLHGLLLGAALLDDGLERRMRWFLVAVVVAKLLWEQWAGALPFTAEAAGGPVVVAAHWYGGIGGVMAAVSWRAGRVLAAGGANRPVH